MRIASLLASATEMVCSLGLADRLVAISHECDYPPEVTRKPRVSRARFDAARLDSAGIDRAVRAAMAGDGSPYVLDAEALKRAAPDVILTQAVCEVCAVPTTLAREAARALRSEPKVISLDAHTLADVLRSAELLGRELGVPDRAVALMHEWQARLDRVRRSVEGADRPSVLAIEWLAPPFVPGHWVPEMIEVAGGRNLAGNPARPSREVPWADLAELDPDVLIVMPCGFGLERARAAADQHADALRAVAPRAIAAGRAFVVDGSAYFNRSGPRVVDGVEILAALLHPDRATGVTLTGRAEAWRT
ncbi:MAG TPA: cobalamin-binding protein [Gemmatimonadales bacterium]|nr:cobalamin-binding protein [Gemmatimonadales bacterium]